MGGGLGKGCSARRQIVLTLLEKSFRTQWPGSGVLIFPPEQSCLPFV